MSTNHSSSVVGIALRVMGLVNVVGAVALVALNGLDVLSLALAALCGGLVLVGLGQIVLLLGQLCSLGAMPVQQPVTGAAQAVRGTISAAAPTSADPLGIHKQRAAVDFRVTKQTMFFLAQDGNVTGPFAWERIATMAMRKEVPADVMVMREGANDWVAFSSVAVS